MGRVKMTGVALLLLHGIWALAALAVHKAVLPTPWAVYAYFPQLARQQLQWHLFFSLYRLGWSMAIATVLGVVIGIAAVRLPRLGKVLDPLIYLTYPLPKIALLPVVMLLFGLGDGSKIILITLIIVFQVIIGVRDAVRQIPSSLYQGLAVMGANRWQTLRFVTWPASLAGLFSALRIALGSAIATLFFTEVYGTEYGIGYLIMDEWNRLDYLGMYGGIVVLAALAFVLFAALGGLEAWSSRWRRAA
ncbi:MAG: ABC transporter permease subunit [Lactobacillus sp.]|jgi:NitT/TauT family transport system permease protein|nr:ABC transporter permease subunit [Lactobacillus sp.]MCI2032838.1 ABC transporter permease subunit [Lactobacillus sp.]